MPLVLVSAANVAICQTLDAVLCNGDQRHPVQIRKINERSLLIEPNDLRDVISHPERPLSKSLQAASRIDGLPPASCRRAAGI